MKNALSVLALLITTSCGLTAQQWREVHAAAQAQLREQRMQQAMQPAPPPLFGGLQALGATPESVTSGAGRACGMAAPGAPMCPPTWRCNERLGLCVRY